MKKCIFVGYPTGYKGWLFYNPATKKNIISERAVFDERSFSGLQQIGSINLWPENAPPPPSELTDLPDFGGDDDDAPNQPNHTPDLPPDAPAASNMPTLHSDPPTTPKPGPTITLFPDSPPHTPEPPAPSLLPPTSPPVPKKRTGRSAPPPEHQPELSCFHQW